MNKIDKFIITTWCGVPKKYIRHSDGSLAVERFQEMKDAGINVIPFVDYGYETNCEALAVCYELGLFVQLEDSRIAQAIREPARRFELLQAVVKDYSSYPSLLWYYVYDEPNANMFEDVADVCRILKELDPYHEPYVNALNNYATEKWWLVPTYEEYLTKYVQTIKPEILSYDHYHFMKGEDAKKVLERMGLNCPENLGEKFDRPGYFDNLEDVITISKKAKIPFMLIVLVLQHYEFRNLTEAELRWEVFTAMCYGAKRTSYFTFWEPYAEECEKKFNCSGAFIDFYGNRTLHYEQISRINKELQAIGDILLPHEIRAVFHIGKESDSKINYWSGCYGDVTEIKADRAVIGFFDNNYVMIVNKDYEQSSDVVLKIKEGKRLLHYNKRTGLWENFNEKLRLNAGDGELFLIQ